jgi:Zn-dependent protease with chaperone function
MHVAVYCPLLASALLGLAAPTLARLLPPATATRLLAASSVLAAAATCAAVALLAATLVGRLPALAAAGHWPGAELRSADPVPGGIAVLALVALCAAPARALRVVVLRVRAVLAARAFCAGLGGGPGRLFLVDDEVGPVAIAAAGGRIVASRSQLAALPPADRRALLAHESAHLRAHHHRYRLAVDVAAAVDPLQRRVRPAVRYATERWADEVAAGAVGSRAVVARALARSALSTGRRSPVPAWDAVALRSGGSATVARVRALLDPPPRQRPAVVLAALALVACTLGASLHAQRDTDSYFDHAAGAAAPTAGTERTGLLS